MGTIAGLTIGSILGLIIIIIGGVKLPKYIQKKNPSDGYGQNYCRVVLYTLQWRAN